MGIGFFPGSGELINTFNNETLQMFSGANERCCIAIPYRDACGRLMAIYGKNIDCEGYISFTSADYIKDTPFLFYKSRKEEQLVVVDGFFDALLAQCIGISGIIGIPAAGFNKGMVDTLKLSAAKKIVLAMSSSALNASAIKMLDGSSFEVSVVSIPVKYDDVDAYRQGCNG
jgi:hypothetical protein